jgi:hypothetical protein
VPSVVDMFETVMRFECVFMLARSIFCECERFGCGITSLRWVWALSCWAHDALRQVVTQKVQIRVVC